MTLARSGMSMAMSHPPHIINRSLINNDDDATAMTTINPMALHPSPLLAFAPEASHLPSPSSSNILPAAEPIALSLVAEPIAPSTYCPSVHVVKAEGTPTHRGLKRRSRSPDEATGSGNAGPEKPRKRGRPPKALKLSASPSVTSKSLLAYTSAAHHSTYPAMTSAPQSQDLLQQTLPPQSLPPQTAPSHFSNTLNYMHTPNSISPPHVESPALITTPIASAITPVLTTPVRTPKALPTVRDHTTGMLNTESDEYIVRESDENGDQKINMDGELLGERVYKIRAFRMPRRGEKLFCLATECAKHLGYRDSYLLFNKNRSLFKMIATQEEKDNMISNGILQASYRSRQIAVVTARSMFRQFGSRMVRDGRRVRDDYWEAKAIKQGFTEQDLAGEKRPGGAQAREAMAQQASQQHQQQQQGNQSLPLGQSEYKQVPESSRPSPLVALNPHIDLPDYSTVVAKSRQEVPPTAYRDQSQPASAAEMLSHMSSSVEINKAIARQRNYASDTLNDIWQTPHEPPSITEVEKNTERLPVLAQSETTSIPMPSPAQQHHQQQHQQQQVYHHHHPSAQHLSAQQQQQLQMQRHARQMQLQSLQPQAPSQQQQQQQLYHDHQTHAQGESQPSHHMSPSHQPMMQQSPYASNVQHHMVSQSPSRPHAQQISHQSPQSLHHHSPTASVYPQYAGPYAPSMYNSGQVPNTPRQTVQQMSMQQQQEHVANMTAQQQQQQYQQRQAAMQAYGLGQSPPQQSPHMTPMMQIRDIQQQMQEFQRMQQHQQQQPQPVQPLSQQRLPSVAASVTNNYNPPMYGRQTAQGQYARPLPPPSQSSLYMSAPGPGQSPGLDHAQTMQGQGQGQRSGYMGQAGQGGWQGGF